jgi:hypothetical protein
MTKPRSTVPGAIPLIWAPLRRRQHAHRAGAVDHAGRRGVNLRHQLRIPTPARYRFLALSVNSLRRKIRSLLG